MPSNKPGSTNMWYDIIQVIHDHEQHRIQHYHHHHHYNIIQQPVFFLLVCKFVFDVTMVILYRGALLVADAGRRGSGQGWVSVVHRGEQVATAVHSLPGLSQLRLGFPLPQRTPIALTDLTRCSLWWRSTMSSSTIVCVNSLRWSHWSVVHTTVYYKCRIPHLVNKKIC